MKKLLTLFIATILSFASVSAFAAGEGSREWTVDEELQFKYTKSCTSGKFDSIYIYQESSEHMSDAVAKYQNSEKCTLVAVVTDPDQQDHWHIDDQNFIDMLAIAHEQKVAVYLELPNVD